MRLDLRQRGIQITLRYAVGRLGKKGQRLRDALQDTTADEEQHDQSKEHDEYDKAAKQYGTEDDQFVRYDSSHRPPRSFYRRIVDDEFCAISHNGSHARLAIDHLIADQVVEAVARLHRISEVGIIQDTFMQRMGDVGATFT